MPFRHTVANRVRIEAPPSQVWDILIGFETYPAWNPSTRRIEGAPKPGRPLVITTQPPGRAATTTRPVVTACVARRRFGWRGRVGLVDAEQTFELTPGDGGTLLDHTTSFGGVLVPLLRGSLQRRALAGMQAVGEALRRRAEAAARPHPPTPTPTPTPAPAGPADAAPTDIASQVRMSLGHGGPNFDVS